MFGNTASMLGTLSHDYHRLRRAALNPYFSKQSVRKLEPMIAQKIEKLCRRLHQARETGEVLNLRHAYAALTLDVITQYSFSKSYGALDADDWLCEWIVMVDEVSRGSHLNKQFGWLLPLMKSLPIWLVRIANPVIMPFINFTMVRVSSVYCSC
jgi:hypothetical protein